MAYTHELSELARKIESHICIEYDRSKNQYKLWLHLVVYKDKLGGRMNISQNGFTIEDCCYGFIMKAKSGFLENYMNDMIVEVN